MSVRLPRGLRVRDIPLRGYIGGLGLANGTDADHDIDIAPGDATLVNASGPQLLGQLASTFTKQIDANWAAGSAAGGFPSGLTLSADTWYHVFLISTPGGLLDAGFDTSLSAANLLSDATAYAFYRRIGSVRTDASSNILGFTQIDDCFIWDNVTVLSFEDTAVDYTTEAAVTLEHAPPGVRTQVTLDVAMTNSAGATLLIRSGDAPSGTETPSTSAAPLGNLRSAAEVARLTAVTNTSQQVNVHIDGDSSINLRMLVEHYLDWRGRGD